jgi:hypothetical protein
MRFERRIQFPLIVLVISLLACSQANNLISPTATNQPTATSIPRTTGNLTGSLVEGMTGGASQDLQPSLANTLVMLCADYRANTCRMDSSLAAYTDHSGAFSFQDLEPGTYVILYNPFKIEDGEDYLSHFDQRELQFSDVSQLVSSMVDGQASLCVAGGPESGVEIVIDQSGNLTFGVPNADTAIYTTDYTLVAEFVEKGIPVTVEIRAGQTSEVTLQANATLRVGENIVFEPAGDPISLSDISVSLPADSDPVQSDATAAPLSEPADNGPAALLSESYDDNQNDWNLTRENASWGDVDIDIQDGVLRASGTMDDSMYYTIYPDVPMLVDAEISVDVYNVSVSSEKTEYGLFFLGLDDYQFMNFTITDRGTFTIMSSFNQDYQFPALDKASDAIRRDEVNTLSVRIQDNRLTFYINNIEVHDMKASDLPGKGMAGIFVDWIADPGVDQVIEFDNFTITAP